MSSGCMHTWVNTLCSFAFLPHTANFIRFITVVNTRCIFSPPVILLTLHYIVFIIPSVLSQLESFAATWTHKHTRKQTQMLLCYEFKAVGVYLTNTEWVSCATHFTKESWCLLCASSTLYRLRSHTITDHRRNILFGGVSENERSDPLWLGLV